MHKNQTVEPERCDTCHGALVIENDRSKVHARDFKTMKAFCTEECFYVWTEKEEAKRKEIKRL